MNFLSLSGALWAAAIAVPALLLLYFLKLRRQERKISSTLLWKKAIQDLQVNAPFQKLRKNLLLLLQLLVMAGLIFALAGPVANFMRKPEQNVVLLIDHSGSMKTIEADGRSRLDHAKDAAIEYIDNTLGDSRALVITFADRAAVACNFTDDKRRLRSAIVQIEPTDAPTNISEAVQLAAAYGTNVAGSGETGWVPDAARQEADLIFFTDGRIADADQQTVTRGNPQYRRVGELADNAGIVAFDVRRDMERPGALSVFAQVENFGPTSIKSDISLLLDNKLLSVQEVNLGPGARATSGPAVESSAAPSAPSSQNIIFQMQHDAGGLVQVNLERKDALAIDNVAQTPIDPPREVRVLVVTDRTEIRYLMDRAYRRALGVKDYTTMTGSQYESAADSALVAEGRSTFDLIVFDNHATKRLYPGNYLFLGGHPEMEGVTAGDDVEEGGFSTWKESDPLLRNLTLDNIYVLKWKRLTLPARAAKLVEGQDSAVISFLTDPGRRIVIVAFDLLESNFRFEAAFPMFLKNVLDYLAAGGSSESGRLVKPGSSITLAIPPGTQEVTLIRPDGSEEELPASERGSVTYARTQQTGLYRASFDDPNRTSEVYAVNVLDANESWIGPAQDLMLGSRPPIGSLSGELKVNEPLWPYGVMAALAILLFEWWVYNRRVMI